MDEDTSKKYWQGFARTYDDVVGEEGDANHKLVINPVVIKLLGDLGGKKVLDAGCGNGYLSRKMAATAKEVIGVDFTEELIEKAKTRGQPNNLNFLVGNLENLKFSDKTFDVVLCNMVLIDVEKIDVVIKEICRVIKDHGRLVVSITHPCFENVNRAYSLLDESGNKIGRVVTRYFDTGLVVDEVTKYQAYHYKLSDYINNFSGNDLYLEEVAEPSSAEFVSQGKTGHAPTFLVMKFRKLNIE